MEDLNYSLAEISNPSSLGAKGPAFEVQVQAVFALLMLTNGHVPSFPNSHITKLLLQAKHAGFHTDDFVAITGQEGESSERKLLCQVKSGIQYNAANDDCARSLSAAWADFQNTNQFNRGRDAIAIISDPLSKTDIKNVLPILDLAKTSANSDEFFHKCTIPKFTSKIQRDKLLVFQNHITGANGCEPDPEEFWEFLRHLHLLSFDLDRIGSTIRSLLHTLIHIHNVIDPAATWARIVEQIMLFNQNAGTITRKNFPDDLQKLFRAPGTITMPAAIAKSLPVDNVDATAWKNPKVLAQAMLLGSWDDSYSGDQIAVDQVLNTNRSTIQALVQTSSNPISQTAGIWTIQDRGSTWNKLGAHIFDEDLEQFRAVSIKVLSEIDPKLALPHDQRSFASIKGKLKSHSEYIRKGIAETLALLGSRPETLSNCSTSKPEDTAVIATREILNNADWATWASLGPSLPMLAEAAPLAFLGAVDSSLCSDPNPFHELFRQESSGMGGSTYISGLLWALESLAWDEDYFMQSVLALAALAAIDPGGTWSNRPANSLTTIFLPWHPQTTTDKSKRLAALKNIYKAYPDVAWPLLTRLLPGQTTTSSGSSTPKWRMTRPDDWEDGVTNAEFAELNDQYSRLIVEIATDDPSWQPKLISCLNNLTVPALEQALSLLESQPLKPASSIWQRVSSLVRKHKRFHDAEWVFPIEIIERLESLATALTPNDLHTRYGVLFPEHDMDLYSKNEDWDEQTAELDRQRISAIHDLYELNGLPEILKFAQSVDAPYRVGFAIGQADLPKIQPEIIPDLIDAADQATSLLANGYLAGKFKAKGWTWVDSVKFSNLIPAQIASFFMALPFGNDTWDRVDRALSEESHLYWENVSVFPYGGDKDFQQAARKLLEASRPKAALRCLHSSHFKKQDLDPHLVICSLIDAIDSKEIPHSTDTHETLELIDFVQRHDEVDIADQLRIEWAYLPMLDSMTGGNPVTLEKSLASNPEFFCDILKLLYKSDHDEGKPAKEPSEQDRIKAQNIFILLNNWSTPPGQQRGIGFSDDAFCSWLDEVIEITTQSGYLDVALFRVGKVLRYTPSADDGLSIPHTVAQIMDKPEMEPMRDGYCNALMNSRGVHRIDPTGQDDIDIAIRYESSASKMEDAGYTRIASSLKHLGQYYRGNAKREQERAALRRQLYS